MKAGDVKWTGLCFVGNAVSSRVSMLLMRAGKIKSAWLCYVENALESKFPVVDACEWT